MKLLKDLMKKDSKHMLLIALLLIYLLFDIQTPSILNSVIDNIFGKILILILAISVFMHSDPVVGILVLLAAYELIRRVSEQTGSSVMKFLPSESKKECEFNSLNNFPVTLEEEIVNSMVPLVTHPASNDLNYQPNQEDIHEASDIQNNNLL
jgi:hypothetical protein